MRRLWTLAFWAALVLAATWPRADAGSAPQPPAHFQAGTEWVYRHTSTADNQTQTGTSTMVYKGQATYRGGSYHLVEYRLSLVPDTVERQFLVWDRTFFRQAAAELTSGGDSLEIVFDRAISLGGAAEVRRGKAEIYQNGALQGTVPWTTAVTSKGTVRVTVPAGTFSATRWEGTYTLGQLRQVFTVYIVGANEVRADIDAYEGTTFKKKDKLELTRGPVGGR